MNNAQPKSVKSEQSVVKSDLSNLSKIQYNDEDNKTFHAAGSGAAE